jgi:uncharacterized membrane protein
VALFPFVVMLHLLKNFHLILSTFFVSLIFLGLLFQPIDAYAYACYLQLLGFAKGRVVMALEGGYNLKSIANSVCACAKVLLGDKFTFNAPKMQPFESTWRVIQMVPHYTICV